MEVNRTTEIGVSEFIAALDQNVWDAIAVKNIEKMAPHKLNSEATHMFN